MPAPTSSEFTAALASMQRPSRRVLDFLEAHAAAPSFSATASQLAAVARYKDFRGVNAAYGRLARHIGAHLSRHNERLGLLVEFLRPNAVTNEHWVLVMRREFAEALWAAGWAQRPN